MNLLVITLIDTTPSCWLNGGTLHTIQYAFDRRNANTYSVFIRHSNDWPPPKGVEVATAGSAAALYALHSGDGGILVRILTASNVELFPSVLTFYQPRSS